MKLPQLKNSLLVFGATILLALGASGQSFVNMNFERARVPAISSDQVVFVDWSQGAPGWSHSGGFDTSVLYYGGAHLAASQCYMIVDAYSPYWAPGQQLAGNYSLAFASGVFNSYDYSGGWINAYIAQTGLIPSSSLSFRMLATGPFAVYVGGSEIPMYSLGGNLYGGDISGFAGTVAELKIMNTAPVGDPQHYTVVDNLLFSSTAIPEPSVAILVLCSLALLRAGKLASHH